MAYSNWGGEVWRDEQPLHENCDATPRQVLGNDPAYQTYWQHFVKATESCQAGHEPDWPERMYHAVVGDAQAGLLVLLYKYWIAGVYYLDGGTWTRAEAPDVTEDGVEDLPKKNPFTVAGIAIAWETGGGDWSKISVSFTDKAGRSWRSVSGYLTGEGHQEWGGNDSQGDERR